MNKHFADLKELTDFVNKEKDGHIVVTHRNVEGYPGMVLYIGFVFNIYKPKYELNFEWMSLGLDLYGDTLQESYMYKFPTLKELVTYLQLKYNIQIKDIPVKYEFALSHFPNPINDANQRPVFEEAWQRFQKDFEKGMFLDNTLELVYSSQASK
jgi:hypothetical protein